MFLDLFSHEGIELIVASSPVVKFTKPVLSKSIGAYRIGSVFKKAEFELSTNLLTFFEEKVTLTVKLTATLTTFFTTIIDPETTPNNNKVIRLPPIAKLPSRLDIAKEYKLIRELLDQGYQLPGNFIEGQVRDYLAKYFGKSGRSLDRYLLVLSLPVRLQHLWDRGLITTKQTTRMVMYWTCSQTSEFDRRLAEYSDSGKSLPQTTLNDIFLAVDGDTCE